MFTREARISQASAPLAEPANNALRPANMLFTSRRKMAAAEAPTMAMPGRMEIVLAGGDRVIAGADVGAAALGRAIAVPGWG